MAAWCADHLRNVEGWRDAGLALSTSSNEAAKLLDGAVRQFVCWTDCKQLNGLEKTLQDMKAADPKAVLPRAFAFGVEAIGTGVGARTNEKFRKELERLQTDAAKYGNVREQMHAKAVQQFGEGKQSLAARTWEEILKDYPTDLIAIKFAHDTYFYLGDSKNIRDSVQAVLPKHKGTEPCYSFLHGMLAFGLEECQQYQEAEKAAKKALDANRCDCWATHAWAHVFEMEGRFDEGIKFLEDTVQDWRPGWMLAAHNFWHLALYYLEKNEADEAVTIYDNEIKPRVAKSGAMLDIVDGASMLWRLELEDVAISPRWQEFPDVVKSHVEDHVLLFNDIHMSMILREGGRREQENKLRKTLVDFARNTLDDENDQAKICRDVGLDLYKALEHYSNAEYSECARLMLPIRDRIYTIGGSNAQFKRQNVPQTKIDERKRKPAADHLSGKVYVCGAERAEKILRIISAPGHVDNHDAPLLYATAGTAIGCVPAIRTAHAAFVNFCSASWIQRDMFTQTLIHACMNSKDDDVRATTTKILEERNAMKKNSLSSRRLATQFEKSHTK